MGLQTKFLYSPGPGRAVIPSAGQASAFRAALWTQIDRLFDQFYQTASKVKLLLKILSKKRDINMSQRTLLYCLLLDLQSGDEEEDIEEQQVIEYPPILSRLFTLKFKISRFNLKFDMSLILLTELVSSI